MSDKPLPSLFVSHGSPMILLEDGPARRFMGELGRELPRPSAILVVSAHWEAPQPLVSTAAELPTIHDFWGFPPELYARRYPAAGAPGLGRRVVELLQSRGVPAAADAERGLDHGAWVPLSLMYPEADVPVVGLSLVEDGGPALHLALGQALRPLREEGVLVLGTGSLTHGLRDMERGAVEAPPHPWVTAFQDWVRDAIGRDDQAALIDYRRQAPAAVRHHPTEDHLLPLFVALGAGGPGGARRRLHDSVTYGALAMDVYAFD